MKMKLKDKIEGILWDFACYIQKETSEIARTHKVNDCKITQNKVNRSVDKILRLMGRKGEIK